MVYISFSKKQITVFCDCFTGGSLVVYKGNSEKIN